MTSDKRSKTDSGAVAYGFHPVKEAVHAGRSIEKVFLQEGLKHAGLTALIREMRTQHIPYHFVHRKRLDRMVRASHQGFVAVVSPVPFYDTQDILMKVFEEGRVPLFLWLDGVTDVRNLGAIARSAVCFGADALLLPVKGSARLQPETIKASAGALEHIPICKVGSAQEVLQQLKDSGLQIVAASEQGGQKLHEVDLTLPTLLVMGGEEQGIRDAVQRMAGKHVAIPMQGKIGSLNVSVAAGVVMYEVVRQRGAGGD